MFNLPIRFTNRKPFGRSLLKLLADSLLYVVIFDYIITALSSLKHISIASNEIWKSDHWLNFKVSFVYILTPPTFGLEAWLRSILSKASIIKSFAAQWIESQDRWFCLAQKNRPSNPTLGLGIWTQFWHGVRGNFNEPIFKSLNTRGMMSSLRTDRRITQRVIRIDICFGSVNWEGPERVLNLTLPSRVWNAGKGVLCSEEGSGKCESSGVKSYGFNLSRDTRYCLLFHTLDEVGNHFYIPNFLRFENL